MSRKEKANFNEALLKKKQKREAEKNKKKAPPKIKNKVQTYWLYEPVGFDVLFLEPENVLPHLRALHQHQDLPDYQVGHHLAVLQ